MPAGCSPMPNAPEIAVAEMAPELASPEMSIAPPARRRPVRWTLGAIHSIAEWIAGAAALMIGLAVLATIPVAGILTLGYFLEATGRIARSGRIRDGFVGVRKAARLGGILLVLAILILPLEFVASLWNDALLIHPGSPAARGLGRLLILLVALAGLHVVCWLLRGGRLRSFLIPPNPMRIVRLLTPAGYAAVRDGLWNFVVSLRLPHYFRLGVQGGLGTLVWLVPPITLIVLWCAVPILAVVGAIWLAIVLCYLPFLQARFAAADRFGAIFEVRKVRAVFRAVPLAFWLARSMTLATAIPLYLLKIELLPREVSWFPALLFVVLIFPARLATGWAYSRAAKHVIPRFWLTRILGRLGMLPLVFIYVVILFFSQFAAWHGVWSLYEQHAFLLPVP